MSDASASPNYSPLLVCTHTRARVIYSENGYEFISLAIQDLLTFSTENGI